MKRNELKIGVVDQLQQQVFVAGVDGRQLLLATRVVAISS